MCQAATDLQQKLLGQCLKAWLSRHSLPGAIQRSCLCREHRQGLFDVQRVLGFFFLHRSKTAATQCSITVRVKDSLLPRAEALTKFFVRFAAVKEVDVAWVVCHRLSVKARGYEDCKRATITPITA